MNSILEGKTITLIRFRGGLVSGQPLEVDLYIQSGIITFTDPEEVNVILHILKQANKMNLPEKEYLQYELVNTYGW